MVCGCQSLCNWPANIVGLTDPHLREAAGFIFSLIGAAGHDGLSSSLRTGHVAARAEKQLVGVLWRNSVKESPQGLVAPRSVTQTRFGGGLDACWHILSAQSLANVINVASFGRIQATVHCAHTNFRICGEFKCCLNPIFRTDWVDLKFCIYAGSSWPEQARCWVFAPDSYRNYCSKQAILQRT